MNPKFFYRVVAPTFVTKGTAFAGITTLGEDVAGKDDVARLLDKKTKTGRSLFKVILMSQVCDLCERNGTAKSCKHLQGEIPWWQDASRHGDLEDMMGQDHLEEYLRETKGFQVNLLNTPAFNHIVIDEIFDEKNDYRGVSHAKHVFMAIDPCAGGARSRFAAISTIYVNGEMVVSFDILYFSFNLSTLLSNSFSFSFVCTLEPALCWYSRGFGRYYVW